MYTVKIAGQTFWAASKHVLADTVREWIEGEAGFPGASEIGGQWTILNDGQPDGTLSYNGRIS